jgi:hypothetical protein
MRGLTGTGTALLAVLVLTAGCTRYYYSQPGPRGTYVQFHADSLVCTREFGIASGNGQYAAVSPDLYRRCMIAKGWEREKRFEPVEAGSGFYRGVESDEPVSLVSGPPQPSDQARTANSEMQCWRRHIQARSDWREHLPAYRECVGQ